MSLLLVFLGGVVGAPVRYVVDRFVQRQYDGVLPWGTLTVNLAGSAVLGALVAVAPRGDLATLAGTGFCGSLTTFSTLGYETVRLAEEGSFLAAALNAAGNLLLGLLAAAGAYALLA